LISAAFVLFAYGAASQARAAELWVTVANLNDSNRPRAHIEVSVDTSNLPVPPWRDFERPYVLIDVFNAAGGLITEFTVPFNESGFANSSSVAPPYDNLFDVSGGLPALVRIRTPGDGTQTSAILRQTLGNSKTVTLVPPARSSDGQGNAAGFDFSVPVGNFAPRATLLIANVSGADVAVELFPRTGGTPGTGRYRNPAWRTAGFGSCSSTSRMRTLICR